MRKLDNDTFELSSGRQVYAHRLMLSIGRTMNGFDIGYGADSDLDIGQTWDKERAWSNAEKQELARYAIKMWNDFLISCD